MLDALIRPAAQPKALAAEKKHLAAGDTGWSSAQPLDRWDLWKLVAVALELGILDKTAASVCDGARGFRNLIHAGKERASQPCDRATALTAMAAVGHVVRAIGGILE